MYSAVRWGRPLWSTVGYFVIALIIRYVFLAMIIAIIFDTVERDAMAVVRRDARVGMVSVFRLVRAQDKALKRHAFARWRQKATGFALKADPSEESERRKAAGGVTLQIDTSRPPTFWEALRKDDRSLLTWSRDHPFRRLCIKITTSPVWLYFITIVIIVTVQCLAVELHWTHMRDSNGGKKLPTQQRRENVRILADFCVIVFVAEFCLEVVARGLIYPATAHLRNPLRVVDTCVTVLAIVGWGVRKGNAGRLIDAFQVLRLLRLWQPLKLLASFSRSVLGILNALERSAKAIFNTFLLVVVFVVFFGLMGQELFAKTMFFCNDPYASERKPSLLGPGLAFFVEGMTQAVPRRKNDRKRSRRATSARA